MRVKYYEYCLWSRFSIYYWCYSSIVQYHNHKTQHFQLTVRRLNPILNLLDYKLLRKLHWPNVMQDHEDQEQWCSCQASCARACNTALACIVCHASDRLIDLIECLPKGNTKSILFACLRATNDAKNVFRIFGLTFENTGRHND